MELGNKTLNDLTSKDFSLQKKAAIEIVQNSDIEAFKFLVSKSEFIFDFIKEKIVKNLISAVDETNYKNLFSFMGVYSQDFKNFILQPLVKFNNDEIRNNFIGRLSSGTNDEKAYAVEFFALIKDDSVLKNVREELNSDFEPLKSNAVKYLASLGVRDEFDSAVNCFDGEADELDKLEAVEFLVNYGDKSAFEPIYKWFLTLGNNDTVASNLLFLKSFSELLSENMNDEVISIYSSILKNFPDTVTFDEIKFYLQEGVLDFLIESDSNFAALLNFYLFNKLELILDDEAYSVDLTNDDKKAANEIKNTISIVLQAFDFEDTVFESLSSDNLIENLMAIELAYDCKSDFIAVVREKCLNTGFSEVIFSYLEFLKAKNSIEDEFLSQILAKTENENIRAVIKSYSSSGSLF